MTLKLKITFLQDPKWAAQNIIILIYMYSSHTNAQQLQLMPCIKKIEPDSEAYGTKCINVYKLVKKYTATTLLRRDYCKKKLSWASDEK